MRKQTPIKGARAGRLGYGLMDLFVVAACAITFAAVVGPGMHPAPKGPPIALIARDLGTTPGQFQQVATILNVSVERLDTVMEKYRPDRLR